MVKKEPIVSYTDNELQAMQARGESKSDWSKAQAMTEAEIEAAIAGDPDEAALVFDWSTASVELPKPKEVLNMRVDADVMAFFRSKGKGYQTKINAILRAYVAAHRQHKTM